MHAPTDQLKTGPNASQSAIETEVATLLVETLQLEIPASEIVPEAPLFNEGLGLDSIDALEIALALSRRYGIELKSDDDRNGEIFASLRSLSAHIERNRVR
jgi:acyl carrier protein